MTIESTEAKIEPFGFSVQRVYGEEDYDNSGPVVGWSVELPHQCGAWAIVGSGIYFPKNAKLQSDAVAIMERFIAEANEALTALREGREYGKNGR